MPVKATGRVKIFGIFFHLISVYRATENRILKKTVSSVISIISYKISFSVKKPGNEN